MEPVNPSVFIHSDNEQLAGALKEILEELRVAPHYTTSIEDLTKIFNEAGHDLFILITDEPLLLEEVVKILGEDAAPMLNCLISRYQGDENTQFDIYYHPDDLQNRETAKRILNSLVIQARKQKIQSELSALLLHDLRSPLQSIMGYLELLEKEIFGEINDGQRQIMLNTIALGDTLIELMEDLSRVYQFESREFELQRTSTPLKELIDQTLRGFWIQADRKNIKFIPQIDSDLPVMYIDGRAIQRVMLNLLTNAIKYTPDNGTVQMVVQKMQTTSAVPTIRFRIVDYGPGIPPESLPYLFDKYFRVHYRKQAKKGIGLGLYISRLIIEAHHGHIGVYNNREGGSTFHFTLPVELPPADDEK